MTGHVTQPGGGEASLLLACSKSPTGLIYSLHLVFISSVYTRRTFRLFDLPRVTFGAANIRPGDVIAAVINLLLQPVDESRQWAKVQTQNFC